MPSTKKAQKAAAARAWAGKSQKTQAQKVVKVMDSDPAIPAAIAQSDWNNNDNHDSDSDIECTGWTGTVAYVPSDSDSDLDSDWRDTDSDLDGGGVELKSDEDGCQYGCHDNNEDLEDLEAEDLLDGLWNQWELLQQELESKPKALASVSVETIRKWEHWMKRWMEPYRGGLDAKQAQFQVKTFSSWCYRSHRRVPEWVAAHFDE
jgi:hypothetical protein